jgi:uncharacterized membrane protein HdeD (DUF308 family)
MISTLIDRWWAVAVVGALAIILGVVSFVMPGVTLASMVAAFGAFALVTGLVELGAGFAQKTAMMLGSTARTYLIVTGVLGVLAGLATFFYPGITLAALYTVIAAWAVLSGITQIAAALVHRAARQHTWLVAVGGAVSVAFGIYMIIRPAMGLLALAYAVGAFALIYGASMLAASYRLKQIHDETTVSIIPAEERVGAPTDRLTPR